MGNDIHFHLHGTGEGPVSGKVAGNELERAMEVVLHRRLANLDLAKHLHKRSSSAAPRGKRIRRKSDRVNQADKCGLRSEFKRVDQVWDGK